MDVHFKFGRFTYEVHLSYQASTGGGHCFFIHKVDNTSKDHEKLMEGWEYESELDALIAAYHAIKKDWADGVEQAEKKGQDGIYLLRDETGYEKTVEATFDAKGKLVRLVDKDGNNWIQWANDVIWTQPRETHQ